MYLEALLIDYFASPTPSVDDKRYFIRIYPRKGRLTPWEKFLNDKKNTLEVCTLYFPLESM